ncbi:MAG: hypothetical protein EOO29_23855 [Comamonadaceae bacterium]|nr:MAG: hypothetical protein EOO29_23855 [Comamonadaceae bacterium]
MTHPETMALQQQRPSQQQPARSGWTMVRRLAGAFFAMALAMPVAFVTTVFLHPFWSWLEATTGLESMGRHGPGEWCYVAVWGVMVLAALLAGSMRWRPAHRLQREAGLSGPEPH